MKLGNISQTIVQVPKFFYDPTKDIDAFKSRYDCLNTIKNTNKCFSFSKRTNLLHTNLDININNNPRLNSKIFDAINKEIYFPVYKRFLTPNAKNDEMKEDKYNTKSKLIKKFYNYKKKMFINEAFNPKLREDLMNSTYNLIEKIKSDYDLTLYSNFDSRSILNQNLNTRYSILYDTIKERKTDKEIFRKVIHNKIKSLRTINPKVKEILKKAIHKKILSIEKEENKKNPENIKKNINILLSNCKTNYLKLKYNNQENYGLSEKDLDFIEKNKSLTTRVNNNKKSIIYKGFPSKTRMEFTFSKKKKLIPKINFNSQIKENDNSFIQKRKEYGFSTFRNTNYKDVINDFWTRPLHKDAYILEEY